MKQYWVYIMSNKSRTLYTGVTNDLARRVLEHKRKLIPGFTKKYNLRGVFIMRSGATFEMRSVARSRSRGGCGQRKLA